MHLRDDNARTPGIYQIEFHSLPNNQAIQSVSIDNGSGWKAISEVSEPLIPSDFKKLFFPVKESPLKPPLIWSGQKTFEGIVRIDNPVIIEPGTKILLGPQATLIFKNKVIAEGSSEHPIQFLPLHKNQEAWASVALQGQGTSNSRFSHCVFSNGSGIKKDLFEYTAMFSIHDSSDIEIRDTHFRDNSLVDDMVHVVYADILFENCNFTNALSDALDIDISRASIVNCTIEHSGNDAIDLMSSRAIVINTRLMNNGDKGISVGEGSQLFASNNRIEGNLFGIQSKDSSTALLMNQTITGNQTALDAYKKNWRYGTGGTILVSKSVIRENKTIVSTDKKSRIIIFDSYVDTTSPTKQIKFINSDLHEIKTAYSEEPLPKLKILPKRAHSLLTEFQTEIKTFTTPSTRGTHN